MTLNREQVEAALESLPNNPKRAQVLLQDALGVETDYDVVGGHIVDSDGNCKSRGCELSAPHNHSRRDVDEEVGMEWLETVADRVECPANLETIEVRRPAYDECPNCEDDAGFRTHCQNCGMPVE